ncbi:hypothetical protein GUJ93_ZPchr0006g40861 [Zizania palustris]|uniref:Uncharacterized protein n=1 Tax=Zizania palustris TaxID=103762 RepID=A0A8J5SY77_ZIZPA|nr:hypothetical protein GUJ93_ZPchr0006g40861 [Zizania palustris]
MAMASLCSPTASSSPLFLLRLRACPGPRLPTHRLSPTAPRCSSSYNGWADLAAEPDPPFPLPPSHVLLPLLLFPVAALSLPRLPPLPLLAAAFAAGFAARHLAPVPTHYHPLAALLDDLDAQLRALGASAAADPALLLHAADRLRDAARLAAHGSSTPVLGDAVKEAAEYFAGLARDTVRDLTFSSPRKKPKEAKAAAAAAAVDTKQEESGIGLLGSATHATTRHASIAQDMQLDSPATGGGKGNPFPRALGMLPFDMDAQGFDDAGLNTQSKEDGRVERIVLKLKHTYVQPHIDCSHGGGFATESMESPLLERMRTLEIRDRSYRLKIGHRGSKSQPNETHGRLSDHVVENGTGSDRTDDKSATMDSDTEEFNHNVMEAAEILRKARECMTGRADEETADALLYKSARLLSTAVALRPSSLTAVGQLGNTYLLHGELKLKVSRELRTLLANSGSLLNGRDHVSRSRKLDRRILSRENISSALVGVCEECESLLVEAGRSYRMALSIDSGDVKALYNWGLALIFRAQLLSDIGPEAAVDADRVYLSAIDKFDAMLSKSNTYAPEALYRWGIALQQRSYLRSPNNKEKISLLEQAKSMFEDVLYVEADNKTVREALSACIAELNYHGRWL